MLERLGTNVTLDQIFEDLYNLISEANRIPLTDKIIVEESDLSTILEDLKEAIPKEVKNAGKVLDDSKNIMNSAREEAAAIVEKSEYGSRTYCDSSERRGGTPLASGRDRPTGRDAFQRH